MPATIHPGSGSTTAATRWPEWAAVAAITTAIGVVALRHQPQIAVNGGRGWDGAAYFALAEQVGRGAAVVGDAPFAHRLLVPAAVGLLFPADPMSGFKVLNAVAVVLVVVLMVLWLRTHFRSCALRVAIMALFLAHWTEPLRTWFWYPVLVDYWFVAAVLGGLLIIERLRAGGSRRAWLPLLCLVSAVAVAIREVGLLLPLAALFTHDPLTGRPWRLRERLADLRAVPPTLWIPLPAGVLALLPGHLLAVGGGTYSAVRSVGYWLLRKGPVPYALGWFISYGPILALPILYWRACLRHLREHQAQAVFLIGVLTMSWIGGNDTERFVTWAAPVVYVLIGIGLREMVAERIPVAVPVLLAVAQAVAARLFWTVPAVPVDAGSVPGLVVLTPLGDDVSVFDLTAWDAAAGVRAILLAEYGVLVVALAAVVVLVRQRRRAQAADPG